MAVSTNKIIGLIVGKDTNSFVKCIIDYSSIKQKLDNPELQNWYFKKGIDSNWRRMAEIKNRYNFIRDDFNTTSKDEYLFILNNTEVEYKEVKEIGTGGPYFAYYMRLGSLSGTIEYCKEMLKFKEKVKKIETIDYYYEYPEEISKLID